MARTIVSFVAPTRGGDATAREGARGWGKARAAGDWGGRKIFFAGFPIPRSPLPHKLGTDPTIVNKIKGLRDFRGQSGGEGRMAGAEKIFKNFGRLPK